MAAITISKTTGIRYFKSTVDLKELGHMPKIIKSTINKVRAGKKNSKVLLFFKTNLMHRIFQKFSHLRIFTSQLQLFYQAVVPILSQVLSISFLLKSSAISTYRLKEASSLWPVIFRTTIAFMPKHQTIGDKGFTGCMACN